MYDYHAVFRKDGNKNPLTVMLSAEGVTDAIAAMCSAAGVHSTNSLIEFEILQVVDKDKYVRVALKTERKSRTVEERMEANRAPVQVPLIEHEPKEPPSYNGETKYVPYNKQLAA